MSRIRLRVSVFSFATGAAAPGTSNIMIIVYLPTDRSDTLRGRSESLNGGRDDAADRTSPFRTTGRGAGVSARKGGDLNCRQLRGRSSYLPARLALVQRRQAISRH